MLGETKNEREAGMTVASILAGKSSELIRVRPDTPIDDVTHVLHENTIGAVLVMEGETLLGILSDRGIVRAMAQNPGGVRAMPAAAAMKKRQFEATPSTTIEEAMRTMTVNRVRYLPVFEEDRLVGLVSIGDVVKAMLDRQTLAVESLAAYVGQT